MGIFHSEMGIFHSYSTKPNYTTNASGGIVVQPGAEESLVNLALLSTFNDTVAGSGGANVQELLSYARQVSPTFLAKTIVYAKESGKMRDSTALLLVELSRVDVGLFRRIFRRVIKDGRDVRNFVQAVRSGKTGRKSLGTALKAEINAVIAGMNRYQLFAASIGNNPSLADVIKLSHYKPEKESDIISWALGKKNKPTEIMRLEAYHGYGTPPSDLPFELWQNKIKDWARVLPLLSYKQVIINLNNMLKDPGCPITPICARIADVEAINRTGWFPFRFYTAALNVQNDRVRKALLFATETALGNVPVLPGKVKIAPDVSGSMFFPATGYRKGATTAIRCKDVAALFAAALNKRIGNERSTIQPFDTSAHTVRHDGFWGTVDFIRHMAGGGTDCSIPLQQYGGHDLTIIISDNESWAQKQQIDRYWSNIKRLNPNAKLVCWDIVPNAKQLVGTDPSVLNLGGFSGEEFSLIEKFAKGEKVDLVTAVNNVTL